MITPNAKPRETAETFMTKTGVFQFCELDKSRATRMGIRNEHQIVFSNIALTGPSSASTRGCKAAVGKGGDVMVEFCGITADTMEAVGCRQWSWQGRVLRDPGQGSEVYLRLSLRP